MECIVEQSELGKIVSLAQSCAAKKTTMPILTNLLIVAQSGSLNISASDIDITMKVSIPAEVRTAGSTTIEAKTFAEVVRELPSGKVTIKKSEGERIEIVASDSLFKLVGISAESYPVLPSAGVKANSVISSKQLSDMIQRTVFASSQDETRANMNGVCFETEESTSKKTKGSILKLVATDGHRLSYIARPVAEFNIEKPIIVPRRALTEIKKSLDICEDVPVKIAVANGMLEVEIERVIITARLTDSPFPSYSQVIPKQEGTIAKVNTEQFIQALRRTILMVNEKNKCIELHFSKDNLTLKSHSPELGEAREELPIEFSGDSLQIGLNAAFLLDVLNSASYMPSINLDLHGETGAVKVTFDEDESYVAIIMPMRIM